MRKFIFLVAVVFISHHLYAQNTIGKDTIRYVIEAIDGNEFTVKILSEDENYIIAETKYLGELKIPRNYIKSITVIRPTDMNKGEYWFDNPHSTRYFYSPNGYNLNKGEGYYQNTWIFFNQLSYGFSDIFTMGVGMVPAFLLGAGVAPVWITPKLGFPVIKDKLNLGAGILAGTIIGEELSLGIAYGTVTYGSRDKNSTLGAGWAFSSDGWAKYPTLTFAAMARFSKKGYFITENYLISTKYETLGLISVGGRSVQKKLAVDYGLVIPLNTGAGVFIAIPWLSITLPFGNIVQQ